MAELAPAYTLAVRAMRWAMQQRVVFTSLAACVRAYLDNRPQ